VGVWRLVGGYAIAQESSERVELFGNDPIGYAVFEPGGRMMVIAAASDRIPGVSTPEMAQLFKSMVAYSGKWSIDSEKFVTEVDLASDPSWIGNAQVRYYAFDGQTLSLRTAPLEHPSFPGMKAIVYADWRKVEKD
ncbi:MAG TPA: lipocalin-like domain-containing protein, partial [Stellaceae bacterium]|nr:lipocalin-like domain-containing protein [Stellaceae bacterium]